jgi:hypothetical protein
MESFSGIHEIMKAQDKQPFARHSFKTQNEKLIIKQTIETNFRHLVGMIYDVGDGRQSR